MDRPTCNSCKFYSVFIDMDGETECPNGECRINPPTSDYQMRWPIVTSDMWCGKHEAMGEITNG